MIFPVSFSSTVFSNGRRFSLQNIFSIPFEITGVYVFYHSRTFVYVGQSDDIRSRLKQHYDASHSKLFRIWLDALDGNLKFTYFIVEKVDLDDLEKSMIQFLQPFANNHRYGEYQPKPINWRQAYV